MSKNKYENYFLVSSMTVALLIVLIAGKKVFPRKKKKSI